MKQSFEPVNVRLNKEHETIELLYYYLNIVMEVVLNVLNHNMLDGFISQFLEIKEINLRI